MNPFVQLLLEVGICVDPAEFDVPQSPVTPPPDSPILSSRPHHYDGEVPVFTLDQINNSQPEQHGFTNYLVIDSAPTLVLDWHDEQNIVKRRPVHRYCRKERFKFILCQLIGCTGRIPYKVYKHFSKIDYSHLPKNQIWNFMRFELKRNGWKIYNRIPGLIGELGMTRPRMTNSQTYLAILKDFEQLHLIWPQVKEKFGRKYFPSLRYIALRLMEKSGMIPVIEIPLTRTAKKKVLLDEIYDEMWKEIKSVQLYFIPCLNYSVIT